jgi:hypothetical protein
MSLQARGCCWHYELLYDFSMSTKPSAKLNSLSNSGGNTTIPNYHIVHWAIAHQLLNP